MHRTSPAQGRRPVKHLPVNAGDTLSRQAIEHIRQVIRSVDERLRYEIVSIENNHAVLKIMMPRRTYHVRPSSQERLLLIERRIVERETQLTDARTRLTDQHPDVFALKAELQDLRQRREEQIAQIAAEETEASTSK